MTGRDVGAVTAPMLQRVLSPYREHCRYVLSADWSHAADRRQPGAGDAVSWLAIDGSCRIPASCYIDDTGHFNAVELNITYNQLLYCGLAVAVDHGLLSAVPWDLEDLWRHQLPDVLILDYHSVFRRPLDPRSFRARFEIREVIPKPHRQMVLLRTACNARCAGEGRAQAEVLIALVNV